METLKDYIKKNWLLIPILAVAGFLRLYHISGYMTFLGDEGRDALIVYNILHGHFTLLGPTASVGGFFLGPIYYYFMAPFLWLFQYDPVGPAVMVALFGIATVWLVYKVGSEFFGQFAGIIAASLYAISPLAIAYSRSSWNPNLMPFFSILLLYLLYLATKKHRLLFIGLSGVLYGIALQLHYIELFLGVVIVAYLFFCLFQRFVFTKNKFDAFAFITAAIKEYGIFTAGTLFGLSLFLLFEVRHGFPNSKSISAFIFTSGQTGQGPQFFTTVGNVFIRLFTRLVGNFPPPEQVSLAAHPQLAVWYYLLLLVALVSVVMLIWQIIQQRKNQGALYKSVLLFLWLFFGVMLFGLYHKSIYDYYFEFMFPLPFLLIGNTFSVIWKKSLIWKLLAVAGIGWLLYRNLLGIPFFSPPNNQKGQMKMISDFVLSKTEGKPFNFALITLGNSDHAYRYFFKLEGRDPMTIDNLEKDPQRKTVADQLLIICEDPKCHPLGASLWEVAGFGRAEIGGVWDVSVVRVYKLIHYTGL